jgi:iron(III) transport system permease protein
MAGQAFKFVTITGKGSRLLIGDLGQWRYLALGGCLAYILLAIVLPYVAIVLGSFLDYITHHITWDKFTLENYARMFRGSDNILAIGNTLLLALFAASIGVTFALLLAFIVQRFKTVRGRGILDYICMLPISIPGLSLALGLLWAYLYLPVPIYGTIWVLLIAYITRFLAQGYRISSSGLLQIGPELEEAARVSGASRLRALANVTVPILATPLLSGWIIIFILAALEISCTIILYSSKSLTMSVAIWNQMAMGETVVAYAMSVILGGIGLIAIIVAQKVFGVFKYV